MSESVEIPDAAVKAAYDAYTSDFSISIEDAVLAALVAARPYLMPTVDRDAVRRAIADELDGEGIVSYGLAPKLTARVMDLLNGAKS